MVLRIDGGSEGVVLLQTVMGEKETVIVGLPTVLLPASELSQYEQSKKRKERCAIFGCINPQVLSCVSSNGDWQ